ncbi:MAG: DNA primase [Akkermansiaceae bacterium]
MGRIPEETIEQIIEAADIVDVIGSYFPLKRAGSLFKANCPFHNEDTPSFTVNPAWQTFKCFGCGESGGAIGFVMKHENIPFVDAAKKLASRYGVPIIEEASSPEDDRKRRSISRLKELNNLTARFYHNLLMKSPDAQHARDYMKSRGFTAATAKKWLIGWAPRNANLYLGHIREKNYRGREIVNAGLGGMKDPNNPRAGLYTKYWDQLMFPIHTQMGDVVGFSGRILQPDDKRGKYINTSDTILFHKSKLLFALHHAIKPMGKEKFALICEGQLDAIALHEAGIENAIAPLGTAFTKEHARLLKRYTDNVTLCYDGDTAGLAAADKAFAQLAASGLTIRLVHLPEGDDPDSYLKAHGVEKFRELLAGAKEFFEAKLNKELPDINIASPADRAKLLKSLADLVASMSDTLLRDATIQSLAIRLRLGADEFRQLVFQSKQEADRLNKRLDRRDQKQEASAKAQSVIPSFIDPSIAYLCHLAMASSEVCDDLNEQIESIDEVLRETAGGELLRTILIRRPNNSPAARQAFLLTLSEPDQLALEQTFTTDLPVDPRKAAQEASSLLLASHFQKKESSLRAQLADPNLPANQLIPLLQKVKELQEFLRNLDSRFIR